ncbi:uncharacterized protein [Epargyreus clarus]|uniref:uncharacterized protein isoform X2 n=1 Tax=Epargyreus clarus TaxID=520877 RepID=UPI003C2FA877
MGDIYDDLENYEQENIIEELKNENKELKCKLEEYATTLDNLQKDFDKLSAEYKKLELNYSSLLKTARAEIERKTTIITNLNVEKDKLVISALQNKGRVHTNQQNKAQNIVNTNKQTETKQVKGVGCDKRKNEPSVLNESDKNAPGATQNSRKDTSNKKTCLPTTSIRASSGSIDRGLKPKTINNDKDKDRDKTESRKSRQNHLYDVDEKDKVNVKKIHNRRKSMPLLNRGDIKFSSEEEQEENPRDRTERNRFKRKATSRDLNDRKHDNDHNVRSGPKASDITRIDEKYASYHDSSREHHKSNNRHHENDRYRFKDNRDKYDSNQRSRRHYSPHRSHYNTRKDGSNDRPRRSDIGSHRILESPPPDKCNPYRNSREVDRYRFHNEETMRHKIHDVMEEPACKRMRTESLNRKISEHVNLPPERDIGFQTAGTQPAQFSYLFLQSPDHVHLENNPPFHQVKEIMGTAATDLDDPRLKSKKYVLKTAKEKVTLSTVLGRDVDMKLVDKTTWGKDKDNDNLLKMPTPLREKPDMTEDLVKDIYMDIDHPILNLSLESGEIECSEDDLRINKVNKNAENTGMVNPSIAKTSMANTGGVRMDVADTNVVNIDVANAGVVKVDAPNTVVANTGVGSTIKDKTEEANTSEANTNAVSLNTHVKCNKPVHNNIQIPDNKNQIIDPTDNVQVSSSFLKKYTIPKVNKPNTHKPLEDVITNIMHKRDKKEQCGKNKTDKEKSLQNDFDIHNPLKLFSSANNICDNKNKVEVDERRRKYSPEKAMTSARDTVEGDLELSDETSDCTEFTDRIRYNKENNVLAGEGTSNVIDIAHKDEKQNSDCINKQHEYLKHGIEGMFDNKHNNAPITSAEVKIQESQTHNEDKTKDMKTKLCDLFGDSSSLITPDDLGIVAPPITNQIVNDYVPLFDNTQDAIDLNVEEMEMVQTRSLKKESDTGVVNDEHGVKHEKKPKNKTHKTNNEGKKKPKNVEKKSTEHVHRTDDTQVLKEDPTIVKTIIISTGVQNNCNSEALVAEDLVAEKGKESQSLDMLSQVNNNEPHCQTLPSLKALATSTPHKVTQIESTLSLPEVGSNSNNNVATKDIGTSSNTKGTSNTAQNSLDVPDVRIIIKRRRKGKTTS